MGVQCVHAALDDVLSQVMVLLLIQAFDVWGCAQTHEQVCHTLGQVQVVDQALHEVLLQNDKGQELLWALNQPERDYLVQIAA